MGTRSPETGTPAKFPSWALVCWSTAILKSSFTKKQRYPILGHKTAILATFFEIWTSNQICPAFTLTLIYKPSLKSIRPKSAILSQKKLNWTSQNSHPLKQEALHSIVQTVPPNGVNSGTPLYPKFACTIKPRPAGISFHKK